MSIPEQPFSLVPEAARKQAEITIGERIEALVHRSGTRVVDVARALGLRDNKLYAAFRGTEHFRLAWLELLPATVERLFIEERAAAHGLELRPVADEDAHPRSLHDVVVELGDVQRAASEGERDGHLSVDDIERELREWDDVERVRASRVAHLRRLLAERGGAVGSRRKSR
ncbi:hypothetical protein [Sandaracinus amylolyticus]|uniref:Uncharacterized protein n=1 Tax=Sandaracinus amylolyticus TaxID=927083 RepID=A0A0F6W6N1_9BACT|nr:hypothetical protein [Sandaracinus amylolyticus]AKF08862.1 hypothetical protein DB32_006011 [Sandaracinus amylolyticus]